MKFLDSRFGRIVRALMFFVMSTALGDKAKDNITAGLSIFFFIAAIASVVLIFRPQR